MKLIAPESETNKRCQAFQDNTTHSIILPHLLLIYSQAELTCSRISRSARPDVHLPCGQNKKEHGLFQGPSSTALVSLERNGSQSMEHSSHAHPLPDGRDEPFIRSSTTSYASCTITSPSSPAAQQPQPQQSEPLNQQTRRLQLRNAGFRAPILPFRRISPLLGASANGIEPFTRPVNNDNSPSSAEKRTLYGEDLPQSPVNILQEIHNVSARKKRIPPKAGFGALFEDDSGKENTSETSWYNGGSNEGSPVMPAATPAKMNQLREVSLNQKTPPPLSSPLAKHVKGRTSGRSKLRSASSETAQYIEHLESELASVLAKLESQTSPRTSKLRALKLRTLTTENRNLKHENSEWQKTFEVKVQEERDKRLDADTELRNSMRVLEDEVDMKAAKIAELEWELESVRVRMRDLEGLEAINQNLEKRIEALTNLLVQSPTKLELSSTSTSPSRTDPSKRATRPRSMFPRLPPSPGGLKSALATVSESTLGRSQSLGSCLDLVESPEDEFKRESTSHEVHSPTCDEGTYSRRNARQSGSTDGRSRASASFRSAPSSASRPTSLHSTCSFGPVSWGLPDYENRSASKQRRMRRFPSGSNSLKPLILPKTADVPCLQASTPAFPPIDCVTRGDISEALFNPASALLSTTEDEFTTEQQERQRSNSWAQEQTLKALEGRYEDADFFGGRCVQVGQSPLAETEEETMGFREICTDEQKRRSRPRSLQKELEEAEVRQDMDSQTELNHLEACEDGMIPVNRGPAWASLNHTTAKAPFLLVRDQQRRQVLDTDVTPKPNQRQPPLGYATPHPVKACPSTSITNDHAYGIFSRLTNIINRTKQDPFILARRLLANAWSLGSKQLGGIGWWLLGLVYGTRWRKRKREADIGTAEDGSNTHLDWQHFLAEASRTRTQEHSSKDCHKTRVNRESWLSPPHVSRAIPTITTSSNSRTRPHLLPCDSCEEPSSRRSLRLWLRFSLSIILAVGMAVKYGPGALLSGNDEHQAHLYSYGQEREPLLAGQRRRKANKDFTQCSDAYSQPSGDSHETNGMDSGYGSVTFAETLGPADFQDR